MSSGDNIELRDAIADAPDPEEVEITKAMYEAGVDAFCLWDSGDEIRLILWSVYNAMRKAELHDGSMVVLQGRAP